MLKGEQVTKYFGGLAALKNVNFVIRSKEIVGLIGPNGAGKTTLFNCISGVYRPTSGRIIFRGEDITGKEPHEICRMGIGRTFQIVKPFPNMTVLENVMVGALYGRKYMGMNSARREAEYWVEFVGLGEKKYTLAKSLILADRKALEIARALATYPELILLDEVAAGLNPSELLRAMNLIKNIRDKLGITVFWVEHVMRAVMKVAERIIVLHHGEKIAEGTPREIASNQKVIDAYLGEKYIF
ncbi:MAG: ABC transporter ATP-binding protein [Candidatus Methanomethylicota archaeon]|uniref:Probable branched-chain amino acid transport ATP-binding protein LivG n=1 Tax=Thermoproteota archaeon TaxID=2056631 RepID=A0A497EVE9_9CREN|nr:MAG: ABC transporter ATP-binding protein [Candidatus Verstraetearchaeota archaeon]